MRVIFMGTPEFAVPPLRALAKRHEVVAVYTRPDAVSARGNRPHPSPVKVAALDAGLGVAAPSTLRDQSTIRAVEAMSADVIVVAAYGLILPPAILAAAALGAVNVHASLLPRWRGAAPVQRAILAGDTVTGVSIMRMEEGLDTGPYCTQATLQLDALTAPQATDALALLGAHALLTALAAIADGSARWTEQDEARVTYAEKLTKADVALGPELRAADVVRRVRASGPTAPARTLIAGRGVTVLDATACDEAIATGAVACTKRALVLGASDGAVRVSCVKPDGKAAMDGCAWARGVRDFADTGWEAPS